MRISQFSPFNLDNWREEPGRALLGAAIVATVATGTALLGGRIATQFMSPGQKLFFFLSRRSSTPPPEVAAHMGGFFERYFFDGIATCKMSWIGSRGPVRPIFSDSSRVPVYGGVGDLWWKTLFSGFYGSPLDSRHCFEVVAGEDGLRRLTSYLISQAGGRGLSVTAAEMEVTRLLEACSRLGVGGPYAGMSVTVKEVITTASRKTYHHLSFQAADASQDILPLLAGHLRFIGAV